MFSKLWKDESGIVALEYLLLATIVGLAMVVGLNAVASAVNVEMTELANAITALDQSYTFDAHSTCNAFKAGTGANDIAPSAPLVYGNPASSTAATIDQAICN